MCKVDEDEEKQQKSIDIDEYEYEDMDLECEEEDEDADEYDDLYAELEDDEVIVSINKEDFEQVEELKPLRVSSWIDPKTGETRHGIEAATRKDDVEIDFDDYTNLSLAAHMNPDPNAQRKIQKRTDEPDVCSICYEIWTSHGPHQVCSLPCGHVYGMSCIKKWFEDASCVKCPQCNKEYTLKDVSPIYETRICDLSADQKAPTRRFSFSRLGYIAFRKYEFARRSYAWDKQCDALKRRADAVRQQNDAMKRHSELLDRMNNVIKQAKALEHRDNALRRATALRLRADALGRRADEYLRSAKTFGLQAKALLERARAFCLLVDAYKPRLKFYVKSDKEFHGFT